MTSNSLAPTYPTSSLALQLESAEHCTALNLERLCNQTGRNLFCGCTDKCVSTAGEDYTRLDCKFALIGGINQALDTLSRH